LNLSTDTDIPSRALDRLRPAAGPGRVGQGTAVEQSRAIAEVQAQVIVAQQMPRDITRANRDMLRSCAMKSLAEKAFYRYKRGGQQITGPSVQLARELARCWGNIQYGITELRRDDDHGQSEMLAFAWDLETNTRSATTFIVQHIRDTTSGSKALTEQRDIYENNANNGARRLREMVFAILPGWYTEDAVSACYAALAADQSDGATAVERAANAVGRFARIGVTAEQLVQKLGAPQGRWSPSDLAQLAVIWKSIERRETSAEAEFGASPDRISAADLAPAVDAKPARTRTAAAKKADTATTDASPAPSDPPPATAATPPQQSAGEAIPPSPAPAQIKVGSDSPGTITDPQIKAIWTIMSTVYGYKRDDAGKDDVRAKLAVMAGRELPTTTVLSFNEAGRILDDLDLWRREAAEAAAKPRDYLELMTAPQDAQDEAADGE
jgi:hypothetical protein